MARRSYDQYCGLARSLEIVGDRWNLLIVRELLIAPARYRDLIDRLPGIATNLLADRMGRFLQGVKSGPRSQTLGWVFAILAVGLFVVWQVVQSATLSQRSSLW